MLSPLLCLVALATQTPSPPSAEPSSPSAPVAAGNVAPARTRLLVFDVKSTGGVSADTVQNLTGLIAALLSEDPRLEVLNGADLRSMLELEGERERMGCETNASCVAEVAGALDARLVVIADVGMLGSLINLNVSLYDQSKAENIGRRAVQATSLEALPTALRPVLATLVVQALGARTDTAVTPSSSGSVWPWALVGGGALGVVGGGVMAVVGFLPVSAVVAEQEKHLDGDPGAFDRAVSVQEQWFDNGLAPALQVGGVVVAVVGVGAIAGGLLMMGGAE
jgi:hypothetical protein